MRLHHFTAREYLPSIARHGLWKGDVPIGPGRGMNAVNLTTLDSPDGHGLEGAGGNKKAVRLSVEIDSDDEKLQRWFEFARRRFTSAKGAKFRRCIEEGFRPETWYFYRGIIEPGSLTLFDMETQQAGQLAAYADMPSRYDRPPPTTDLGELWRLNLVGA